LKNHYTQRICRDRPSGNFLPGLASNCDPHNLHLPTKPPCLVVALKSFVSFPHWLLEPQSLYQILRRSRFAVFLCPTKSELKHGYGQIQEVTETPKRYNKRYEGIKVSVILSQGTFSYYLCASVPHLTKPLIPFYELMDLMKDCILLCYH
jgi:hypothetical protein